MYVTRCCTLRTVIVHGARVLYTITRVSHGQNKKSILFSYYTTALKPPATASGPPLAQLSPPRSSHVHSARRPSRISNVLNRTHTRFARTAIRVTPNVGVAFFRVTFRKYRETRTRTTIYPEFIASTTKFTLRLTFAKRCCVSHLNARPKTDKTTFLVIFRYNTGRRAPVKIIDTRKSRLVRKRGFVSISRESHVDPLSARVFTTKTRSVRKCAGKRYFTTFSALTPHRLA